jgi:hypothetical protein
MMAVGAAFSTASATSAAFDGFGEWRGAAQYMVARHGEQSPAVEEIVPLVIRVDPDGRVSGVSTENGCKLSGLGAPMGANVLKLDLTLRDCKSNALNRRLSGTLAHYPTEKRATLSLQLIDGFARPVTTYDVKATALRR